MNSVLPLPAPPPAAPSSEPVQRLPHRSLMSLMRRWAPWAVIALVVVVAGTFGINRPSHPSLQQQTYSLANQVRCPVCEGQSVAQSQAPPSLAIYSQIQQQLAAGDPSSQVLARIVSSYGPGILERPPARGVSLVVWVVPVIAVLGAVVGLVLAFGRWRPSKVTRAAASDRDRALVGKALGDPGAPFPGGVA